MKTKQNKVDEGGDSLWYDVECLEHEERSSGAVLDFLPGFVRHREIGLRKRGRSECFPFAMVVLFKKVIYVISFSVQ